MSRDPAAAAQRPAAAWLGLVLRPGSSGGAEGRDTGDVGAGERGARGAWGSWKVSQLLWSRTNWQAFATGPQRARSGCGACPALDVRRDPLLEPGDSGACASFACSAGLAVPGRGVGVSAGCPALDRLRPGLPARWLGSTGCTATNCAELNALSVGVRGSDVCRTTEPAPASTGSDQERMTRHIGLIAGIGPAATDFYYRSLITRSTAFGGVRFAVQRLPQESARATCSPDSWC
jgi:hypothetical protein